MNWGGLGWWGGISGVCASERRVPGVTLFMVL